MARSYYHDAVGTLLVYDVTNRASFSAVEQWLGDARQLATPGVVVILVGNKKDLQVSWFGPPAPHSSCILVSTLNILRLLIGIIFIIRNFSVNVISTGFAEKWHIIVL